MEGNNSVFEKYNNKIYSILALCFVGCKIIFILMIIIKFFYLFIKKYNIWTKQNPRYWGIFVFSA